jgi:hypothetical protein
MVGVVSSDAEDLPDFDPFVGPADTSEWHVLGFGVSRLSSEVKI